MFYFTLTITNLQTTKIHELLKSKILKITDVFKNCFKRNNNGITTE